MEFVEESLGPAPGLTGDTRFSLFEDRIPVLADVPLLLRFDRLNSGTLRSRAAGVASWLGK